MGSVTRRFDRASVRKAPRRDAWGNLHVQAVVCTPGVYPYAQPDGTVRMELKPPGEVYSSAHIESVRDAVVTDEHPMGGIAVTPENFRRFARGFATGAERSDDGLVASLKITDEGLISEILSGKKTGVSLGLDCVYHPTPGVWTDEHGVEHRYDGVQMQMTTNQISATRDPRVSKAEIRLDSLSEGEAAMIEEKEERKMSGIKLKVGDSTVEVEPGAGAIIQSRLDSMGRELDSAKRDLAQAKKERDELQARFDTASEELEKAKKQALSSEDIPKMFAARRKLFDSASVIMDEKTLEKCDAMPAIDVMREACKANDVNVDGKSEEYIAARFDALVDARRSDKGDRFADRAANVSHIHPQSGGSEASIRSRVEKSIQRSDSLALVKGK